MDYNKYLAKSGFFKIKFFIWTQDYEMKSRSSSPMKVSLQRYNHISQTFHIDHLSKEEKN